MVLVIDQLPPSPPGLAPGGAGALLDWHAFATVTAAAQLPLLVIWAGTADGLEPVNQALQGKIPLTGFRLEQLSSAEHQRLLLKAEAARRRAIAAQARLERIDSAKSAMRGAVTGAGRLVTDNVAMVANEALLMATETIETVTRSVQIATGTVEVAWRNALVYAARGWRSLKA